jgi:hypothetical protein
MVTFPVVTVVTVVVVIIAVVYNHMVAAVTDSKLT